MPSNKDKAIEFLHLAASGRPREGAKRLVHPDFVHHNPYFKGDTESLLRAMEENAKEYPDKKFEILRVLEDGDLVAVHERVKLTPESPVIALIHIFQFKDGKMIEEWEAATMEPDDMPNENGMF